jgi:hypothetical protein
MRPFGSAARQAEWHYPMTTPSAPHHPVGRRASEGAHRLNHARVLVQLGGLQSAILCRMPLLAGTRPQRKRSGLGAVRAPGHVDVSALFSRRWRSLPERSASNQARRRNPPNPERAREALRQRFTCCTANVFRAGLTADEQARLVPRERRCTMPRQTVIKSAGAHG